MVWFKVLCLEEPLNCECLQHTLCDDESSQCCRCFYYTFLGCGRNWCLPKCEECGAVKVLERGICDECWDHMLDLIKNLGDALRRMQGEYREFKFQAQFDPKQAQNPTQNPCMNPPPFIDRNSVLEKNGITDMLSAKKWLIQHHPDKTKDEFDIDEFQEILN